MPTTHPITRQYFHATGDDEVAQHEATQFFDAGIIEHGPLIGVGDQPQAFDPIVGG